MGVGGGGGRTTVRTRRKDGGPGRPTTAKPPIALAPTLRSHAQGSAGLLQFVTAGSTTQDLVDTRVAVLLVVLLYPYGWHRAVPELQKKQPSS